jgi:transaldolase
MISPVFIKKGPCMRPKNLKTRIFLDGSDCGETNQIIRDLGFLDGQTTNPTLFSKNPRVREMLARHNAFSKENIYTIYKEEVEKISSKIPEGSVSIEVYADKSTTGGEMMNMAREMFSWVPNAHIKFPTTREGLIAAEQAVGEGMRVNLTLCFSQEQAASVYAATRGANKGQVFVSPFVGRLDDRGENGMDLIANILRMYAQGDGHVEVLSASIRKLDQLLYALKLGSDIATVPFTVLKEWANKGAPIPDNNFIYQAKELKPIPYKEIGLNKNWKEYDISHDLTIKGIEKFSADWNALIQ